MKRDGEVPVRSNSTVIAVDEGLYPLDAIHGAAFLFVDRCYVFLTRAKDGRVHVRLTARGATTREQLRALAGEFGNELTNQVLRLRLAESTARIREYYSAAALHAANAGPSIDDLLAELEAEELAQDPLDISVPWEEKYGAATPVSAGDAPEGEQGDG